MPGGDRTGPSGMGSMTGRGAGYCAGYSGPGSVNPIPGRGYGMGFGRGPEIGFRGGRGGRWGVPYAGYAYSAPYAPSYSFAPTPEQETSALRNQAQYFEDTLEEIKKRIEELESKKSTQ